MNQLRVALSIAILAISACSHFGGKSKKGSARMYEGDSSPVIKMYEQQGPGSGL